MDTPDDSTSRAAAAPARVSTFTHPTDGARDSFDATARNKRFSGSWEAGERGGGWGWVGGVAQRAAVTLARRPPPPPSSDPVDGADAGEEAVPEDEGRGDAGSAGSAV